MARTTLVERRGPILEQLYKEGLHTNRRSTVCFFAFTRATRMLLAVLVSRHHWYA